MKAPPLPASPAKSALDDLNTLHHLFRLTLKTYSANMEEEFRHLAAALEGEAKASRKQRVRDAGDIMTLIRMLTLKPERGRRRDLKKIEEVVADLRQIVETWEPEKVRKPSRNAS